MSQKINNNLSTIANSEFVVVFGSILNSTNEELTSNVQKAIDSNNANVIYMHPVDDKKIENKYSQYVKYEVGSEEGICALLLEYFAKDCDENVQAYIDDLDVGYLSAESSVGEEEFEHMVELSSNKKNKTLVISSDILAHERISNISKLLGVLNKFSDFTIVIDSKEDNDNLNIIQNYSNECLEDVAELKAYDGTVVYKYQKSETSQLLGGSSFARVAKVNNDDEIIIKHKNGTIRSVFKLDEKLQGTIALYSAPEEELKSNDWLCNTYSYKQVKIEKVNA